MIIKRTGKHEDMCEDCYLKESFDEMKKNNLCDIRAIDILDFLHNGKVTNRSGAEIYSEHCKKQWDRDDLIRCFWENIKGVYDILCSAVIVPSVKHQKEMTCGYDLNGRQGAVGELVIKYAFAGQINRAFEEFIDCVEDCTKFELYESTVKCWERNLSVNECYYLATLALAIAEALNRKI